MELPGVGRYTACAVASIAFGEPVAVVDGNVKRVIDRLINRKSKPADANMEKQYWEIAGQLLDRQSPGDFNQAMMELGALVCLPGKPMCHACPVANLCGARGPTEKAERPARRKAELHYALERRNGSILLRQRNKQSSLMPGMWELPEIEAAGKPNTNAFAEAAPLHHHHGLHSVCPCWKNEKEPERQMDSFAFRLSATTDRTNTQNHSRIRRCIKQCSHLQ